MCAESGSPFCRKDIYGLEFWRLTAHDYDLFSYPGWLRKFVIPEKGHVHVYADYRAMDFCVLAGRSEDRALQEVLDGPNDFYTTIASKVLGVLPRNVEEANRAMFKAALLAIIYSKTPWTLKDDLGIGYGKQIKAIALTGARAMESSRWKWSDYDAITNRIRIDRQLDTRSGGKDEKGRRIPLFRPPKWNSTRWIDVMPTLSEAKRHERKSP